MRYQAGQIWFACLERYSMRFPKFHDRTSLVFGIFAGLFIAFSGLFNTVLVLSILQMLIGFVLAMHCFDMIKYYKKHRIVKIVKTDTHRIITRE